MRLIRGKDAVGCDSGSAIEGLIFQLLALLNIHAKKRGSKFEEKLMLRFHAVLNEDPDYLYGELYTQMSLPHAYALMKGDNDDINHIL